MRASPLWSAWAGVLLAGSVAAAPDAAYLNAHCVECHGEDSRKRGWRLDTLAKDLGKPDTFATWLKVFEKSQAGISLIRQSRTRSSLG